MKPQLLNTARHAEPWRPASVAADARTAQSALQPGPADSANRAPDKHAEKTSSRRLHRKQAAVYLGTSLSWLDKSRLRGDGPAFLQVGGRVIYDVADLDAFLASCRRQSTSDVR